MAHPHRDSAYVEFADPFRRFVVVCERTGGMRRLRVTAFDGGRWGRYDAIREQADRYAFMLDAVGMAGPVRASVSGLPATGATR